MGYEQIFWGALEFPDDRAVQEWKASFADDDVDPDVIEQIEETIEGRIANLKIYTYQPASLYDTWNWLLAELAGHAVRGYVVSMFVMTEHETDFYVYGPTDAATIPSPRSSDTSWFPTTKETWRFGPGEDDVHWIVDEGAGRFSIREWKDDAFNETLSIRFLKQSGSALYDADADNQLWIDGEWEVGDATLTHGDGTETISIQRCVGVETLEIDRESVPAKRFHIESRHVPNFEPEYLKPDPPRTSLVEITVAKGHGIVAVNFVENEG